MLTHRAWCCGILAPRLSHGLRCRGTLWSDNDHGANRYGRFFTMRGDS
ncbi:hypothetical protein ZBT109_1929 [Zymobacter palmae]|uniref:Uncharacterized protein n=1 Tax=Zymobacter palmae TaxID=33074 RepID=A0A348HGC3_9GAMM|nr:hypothetical protein ZBT109_1929 [Zymobacter palmae]